MQDRTLKLGQATIIKDFIDIKSKRVILSFHLVSIESKLFPDTLEKEVQTTQNHSRIF